MQFDDGRVEGIMSSEITLLEVVFVGGIDVVPTSNHSSSKINFGFLRIRENPAVDIGYPRDI